ncbi:hypothetical protein [Zavarzinella formosa]|uniref:hypothetical protein n=1 Tax=Zavarzinella formosa TaxID=360055 RepID=UPI00031AFA70|nr:hypothetical protein [Zavarzinella formosa]
MEPLFANSLENVGRTLLNFLAIGGGFLLGSIAGWAAVRVAAKFILLAKPNKTISLIARALGGIAGAILVALFVFGDGGWGFGGSGGGLPGGPGGTDKQQPGQPINEEPKAEPKKIEPPKIKPKPPETDDSVKVVVLGGDATQDRFYLLEDEKAPSTLEEVTLKVEARNQAKKLSRLTIYVYKNSAAMDSAVVGDLKDLARKLDLSIDFPPVQRELRK